MSFKNEHRHIYLMPPSILNSLCRNIAEKEKSLKKIVPVEFIVDVHH